MILLMDMNERRAWGPLIREARKAQGIDQETLAQMAGTSRRTVGSIERGDTVAQTQVLKRILQSLGLSEGLGVDSDVNNFLAMIGPLLQRLDGAERARVMPAIAALIAEELRGGGSRNVLKFPRPSAVAPTVTEADLIDEPSAAEPERNDVEGDEDPEDT